MQFLCCFILAYSFVYAETANSTIPTVGQGQCYLRNKPKPTTTSKTTTTSNIPSPTGGPVTFNANQNKGSFGGTNSGIGSWFRASSRGDSTNGNSWCGYPYKDYSAGFAPDISQMTGGTNAVFGGSNYASSAQKWCGMECSVYNPKTGVTKLLYIIDGLFFKLILAFDHQWVRSPGSIDIMAGAWSGLTNQPATDKNNVIQGVTWTLTGGKSAKYSYGGQGDP